jgi:capsule polysaccharide export protein KpsE/RkpR
VNPPSKNPVPLTNARLEIEPEIGLPLAEVSPQEPRRVTWIRLLWQQRAFLRRATLCGFALALLAAILLPSRYESTARLMPPEQQSGSGLAMLAALAGRSGGSSSSGGGASNSISGGLSGIAGDLLGLKTSGALFVDMIGGPTIQDTLIQKFDLRTVYHAKYWESARRQLARHTTVKEDRKSGVISISVSDSSPQRAQQMAQAYVDALNSVLAKVSTSSARRERIFLEGRLQTVKRNLDNASQQFSEFASQNATYDVPSQARAMLESEASLEGQLVAAESELEGLKQVYTDQNIRVRSLNARIAALKQQVENMSGNKSDLNGNGSSQIPGDFPSIRKLPLVGVRWANLYRENKLQETVYELLTQEYEMAKIQEAKEIPTVNVLDPPLAPETSSFPPRNTIVVLGVFLAFALAGTYVIVSDAWRQSNSAEKQLADEIWAQLRVSGSRPRAMLHQFWARVGGHNGSNGKAA